MRLSPQQLLDIKGRIASINRACYELEDTLLYYEEAGDDAGDGPAAMPNHLEPMTETPEEIEEAFLGRFRRLAGKPNPESGIRNPESDVPLVITGQGDTRREYYPKDL